MALLKSLLQHFSIKSTAGLIFLVLFSLLWETKPAKAQLQELDINPISVDGAIPIFRDYPDMAAIIIRSSLTNLTFSSNLEIIEERSDPAGGEYILIIEPVTQTIRIDTPGFLAGRIPVRGLSARQVVYYSVEPVAQEADDTIPVVIRVNPVDARVEYNGEPLDLSRSVPFETGSHTLTLSREHYHSRTETIEVSPDNTFFEFQMEPLREHLLRIRSEPAGAMVYINGVEQGTTDQTGVLELFRFPGTYHIEIILSGHERTEQNIEIGDDSDNTFSYVLQRNSGILSIQVEPRNAMVTLNRQHVDANTPQELAPGTYRLEAERQGYESFSETLTVERGQQLERTITLQPHTGSLLFQVSPSFAQSTLRDNNNNVIEEWTGSQRINVLKTGIYILTVSFSGWQTVRKTIEVLKDYENKFEIQLEEGIPCDEVLYDIEGNTYKTITISDMCWMAENLNTSTYLDGTPINYVTDDDHWRELNSGAYSYSMDDTTSGKLYNWYATNHEKGICPENWKIPSMSDWEKKEAYINSIQDTLTNFIKSENTQFWFGILSYKQVQSQLNGYRSKNGTYTASKEKDFWWSSSEPKNSREWLRNIFYTRINNNHYLNNKNSGFSIRCIKYNL